MNLSGKEYIKNLLKSEQPNIEELLALFTFGKDETVEKLVLRFNLWARYLYPSYFQSKDAPFHKEIDTRNAELYLGLIPSFTDIAFRGASKTTRTKLFIAFCIANDLDHRRRYIKILAHDGQNSTQFVTDIYNLLVDPRIKQMYPNIWQKTDTKREETRSSFTTATGLKITADTVGAAQRGQVQEDARPDFIIFDDFENRTTLRSPVVTKAIWDNMEEARTGLAKGGVVLYMCNYISERGNVHKLVERQKKGAIVLIVPIIKNGVPAWESRYSKEDIEKIKSEADDFEGEYLCQPSASKDVIFNRARLDAMPTPEPIKETAGFKMFRKFDASHRYAGGADVAGGVGLDSSTSVFIDFDIFPAEVVATFADNEVKPDIFGDELARQGREFGECLLAPEKNNHGHATIGRLKQIYNVARLYQTQRKDSKALDRQSIASIEYGWETNGLTKSKMLFALAKAVDDGHLQLNDPRLIAECRSYTRNDLMDAEVDVRLTTRHFDLLIACAIAWQMKNYAVYLQEEVQEQPPYEPTSEYETGYGKNAKGSGIHYSGM